MKALKKKGCCLDAKPPTANNCRNTKSPVQKTFEFFSQRSKERNKSKKKKDSQENAVEKRKKKVQYAIYRGTNPRKAKRPNSAIIETTCCLGIPRVGGSS